MGENEKKLLDVASRHMATPFASLRGKRLVADVAGEGVVELRDADTGAVVMLLAEEDFFEIRDHKESP